MIEILLSSSATENSRQFGGNPTTVSRTRLSVIDDGSWNGVIKVAARLLGAGQAGLSTYPIYLPITKITDGTTIAAATGIIAAGIYDVDTSGFECRLEHTRTAGTVSVRGDEVAG